MDQQRRPAKRDGGRFNKKGRGGGGRFLNNRNRVVSDSTAAEDLAEYVIGVLARDPDAVQITRSIGGGRSRLSVSCDPSVTGRLIGKEGRTITALRQVVRAVAGRYGKRVDIEVALQEQ